MAERMHLGQDLGWRIEGAVERRFMASIVNVLRQLRVEVCNPSVREAEL